MLILVGNRLSNAGIAGRLSLTESTVNSRVNRILGRLGVTNRDQTAIMVRNAALRQGASLTSPQAAYRPRRRSGHGAVGPRSIR